MAQSYVINIDLSKKMKDTEHFIEGLKGLADVSTTDATKSKRIHDICDSMLMGFDEIKNILSKK